MQVHLPLEILPHILHHLQWRTRDLHACCLVSRTWNEYATPALYSRLFLRDQQRLIKVLQTLEESDHLATLVRVLEIRVFPFGIKAEDLERLEASLLATLLKASRLEELYWTRTGSLTDRVIPFLPALPSLQTLELTGSSRFYSPANITKHLVASHKTPKLAHFSILLPDRAVCDELPRWALQMGAKLRSFSVLCQHSAVVTDQTLRDLSRHLSGLTRLSIAGAKRVTADGIKPLLQSGAMRELAMEGLALVSAGRHCYTGVAIHSLMLLDSTRQRIRLSRQCWPTYKHCRSPTQSRASVLPRSSGSSSPPSSRIYHGFLS